MIFGEFHPALVLSVDLTNYVDVVLPFWFVGFVVVKCYRDDLSFSLLPDCFLFTVCLADSGVAAAVGIVSCLSFFF